MAPQLSHFFPLHFSSETPRIECFAEKDMDGPVIGLEIEGLAAYGRMHKLKKAATGQGDDQLVKCGRVRHEHPESTPSHEMLSMPVAGRSHSRRGADVGRKDTAALWKFCRSVAFDASFSLPLLG